MRAERRNHLEKYKILGTKKQLQKQWIIPVIGLLINSSQLRKESMSWRYFSRSLTNWNVTIKRYNTKLLRMPQEEKRGSWTYEILSNNVQEISKINVTKLEIQGSQKNQAVKDKTNQPTNKLKTPPVDFLS